jgi:GNAT superfamily N-acetyltransferase
MKIIEFNRSHMQQAMEIAKKSYEEERLHVPILPRVEQMPDLTHFADNQLGVVALEDDKLIGYLCTYSPREDAFGTTKVKGTFSPIHAHGVIRDKGYNRDRMYSLLYEAAAQKWVKEGIRSHAIALYTHDKEGINSFFYNGFGLRCIDAIRSMDDIPSWINISQLKDIQHNYCEVPKEEWRLLLQLNNGLITHLGNSPSFMYFDSMDEEEIFSHSSEGIRYFAVKAEGNYIAYMKTSPGGENFATETDGMVNICGAYCGPNFRGIGVYHNLLSYVMTTLRNEGYQQLGVDCESFNPTARGFWLKYFAEYTHSVVRRIDEKAVDMINCNKRR